MVNRMISPRPGYFPKSMRRACALAAASLMLAACLEPMAPERPAGAENELATALAFTTHQAEAAAVSGALKLSVNTGYTGTGYVDFQNASNDYVQWTVSAGTTGDYDLVFRYSLGGASANRPLRLTVDGATVNTALNFPNTGGWSTWKTVRQRARLSTGTRRIRLTAIGFNGGNIDRMDLDGPVVSGGCSHPDWVAGRGYVTGNIVRYPGNGKYYIATHDNPGYDPTISTWFWSLYTNCGGSAPIPEPDPTPQPGTGLGAILSESMFNAMFPNRNSFYSYSGLLAAAATYPAFATSGDLAAKKREVAAFLANVAHETGFLRYIEQIEKGPYCSSSGSCPCASGKSYYGRGPLQLSWNYNYCSAGAAIGIDLRADPDRVARDAKVAWQTSLWFWMTQSGAGYRPCHQSIVNGNGFGETIRSINGALECGGRNPGAVSSRVNNYRNFCTRLGVDPGSNLGC